VRELSLRFASAVLCTIGAAIAGYLVYVHETGSSPLCVSGGCETVQSSSYAEVAGIPVATLGLLGFLAVLAAALARGEWARLAHATPALAAFLFSAYLVYVQLAVIGAVCQWCVAADVLTSVIAALALLRLRHGAVAAPAPVTRPYPRRRPNGSRRPARKTKARTPRR
jgi:uncharacterized membrane protein